MSSVQEFLNNVLFNWGNIEQISTLSLINCFLVGYLFYKKILNKEKSDSELIKYVIGIPVYLTLIIIINNFIPNLNIDHLNMFICTICTIAILKDEINHFLIKKRNLIFVSILSLFITLLGIALNNNYLCLVEILNWTCLILLILYFVFFVYNMFFSDYNKFEFKKTMINIFLMFLIIMLFFSFGNLINSTIIELSILP